MLLFCYRSNVIIPYLKNEKNAESFKAGFYVFVMFLLCRDVKKCIFVAITSDIFLQTLHCQLG
jgi:hypothetical protein